MGCSCTRETSAVEDDQELVGRERVYDSQNNGIGICMTASYEWRDLKVNRRHADLITAVRGADAKTYAELFNSLLQCKNSGDTLDIKYSTTGEINLAETRFTTDNLLGGGLVGAGLVIGVEQVRGLESSCLGAHDTQRKFSEWLNSCGWSESSVTVLLDDVNGVLPTADRMKEEFRKLMSSGADSFWLSYSGPFKQMNGEYCILGSDRGTVSISELRTILQIPTGASLNIFMDVVGSGKFPNLFPVVHNSPGDINANNTTTTPTLDIEDLAEATAQLDVLTHERIHLLQATTDLRREINSAQQELEKVETLLADQVETS